MTSLTIHEREALLSALPRMVLSSRLGAEDYGIDILAVQEIRRYEPPTRIANAASHLRGVMDLRGVIVPIVDLRRLLNLPAEHGVHTVTVVVNVGGRTLGLVVDSVAHVVPLDASQVQPPPDLGPQRGMDFIAGLARVDAAEGPRLLLLIDLAALVRDL